MGLLDGGKLPCYFVWRLLWISLLLNKSEYTLSWLLVSINEVVSINEENEEGKIRHEMRRIVRNLSGMNVWRIFGQWFYSLKWSSMGGAWRIYMRIVRACETETLEQAKLKQDQKGMSSEIFAMLGGFTLVMNWSISSFGSFWTMFK